MECPYFPNEIWEMIINNLDVDDKLSCRMVCSTFKDLYPIEKVLFEKFEEAIYIIDHILIHLDYDALEYMKQYINKEEILNNIIIIQLNTMLYNYKLLIELCYFIYEKDTIDSVLTKLITIDCINNRDYVSLLKFYDYYPITSSYS